MCSSSNDETGLNTKLINRNQSFHPIRNICGTKESEVATIDTSNDESQRGTHQISICLQQKPFNVFQKENEIVLSQAPFVHGLNYLESSIIMENKISERLRTLKRHYTMGGSVCDVKNALIPPKEKTIPRPPPSPIKEPLDKKDNKECSDENNEQAALIPLPPDYVGTEIYIQRWYILFLFSLLALTQSAVWNTWGPIAQTGARVFGWDEKTIALLSNWTCITCVLSMVFYLWLMEKKGLRFCVILSAGLIVGGTGIRCLSSEPPLATWLMHFGAILNGLGGPVSMAAPPVVSNRWFPVQERTTATAIGSIFIYMGIGIPFIVGPIMVREDLQKDWINLTSINESIRGKEAYPYLLESIERTDKYLIQSEKNGVMNFMYIEFGWSTLLFIALCIYFPERPPKPPSITASTKRLSFVKGIQGIVRNKGFWLVALPYALSGGFYIGWSSVIDVILNPIDVSQESAGWLGFFATIGGCIAGLMVGKLADIFAGHMKIFIILLFLGSALLIAWFTAICMGWTTFSLFSLYLSCIGGISLLNGTIPLFFEMSCESCYPIAEFVTCGMLTLSVSFFASVLLFLFWIPGIGTDWVNWCLLGSVIFCIPLLVMFREHYNRLLIDQEEEKRKRLERRHTIVY